MKIEQKKNKKIDCIAEFLITVTWPDKSLDDVDTYLQDPVGHLVWFGGRQHGFMHLDRDDLGQVGDQIVLPSGQVVVLSNNREIVTIRKFLPGEYVVNLHMYCKRSPKPTKVTVTIEKLNPYQLAFSKEITLVRNGDEKTVTRFTVSDDGEIVSLSDLPKRFTGPGGVNR